MASKNKLTAQIFSGNAQIIVDVCSEHPLRKGDSGELVKLLQITLLNNGASLPISTANMTQTPDGIFGAETEATLMDLQRSHGLTPNGILDVQTLHALDANYNPIVTNASLSCGCGYLPTALPSRQAMQDIDNAIRNGSSFFLDKAVEVARSRALGTQISYEMEGLTDPLELPRDNHGNEEDPGTPSGPSPGALIPLSDAQRSLAHAYFGDSLDVSMISISDSVGPSANGAPWTLAIPLIGNRAIIIMYLGTYQPSKGLLLHELTHAWQSQHHFSPIAYMTNAAESQALAGLVPGASAYKYIRGKWFGEYAAEQIASQVQDELPEILSVIRNVPPYLPIAENLVSLSIPRYEV